MPVKERPIVQEQADIGRRVGIPLMAFFLIALGIPMIVQPIYEVTVKHDAEAAKERALREAAIRDAEARGEPVDDTKLPQIGSRISRIQAFDIFRRIPNLGNIQKFEKDIAREAIVAVLARPYTQMMQLTLMRQGSEEVVVGRDGWLFHRPVVFYVTGYGFRSTYAEGDATPQAKQKGWDPLPAILGFQAQLESRGVDLVLVPLPGKAQIYPEKLTALAEGLDGPVANIYAREFFQYLREPKGVADLRKLFNDFRRQTDRTDLGKFLNCLLRDPKEEIPEADVLRRAEGFRTGGLTIVDLGGILWKAKAEHPGEQIFLALDTHWTPLGMKIAAKALAEELRRRFPWLAEDDGRVEYRTRTRKVTRYGDLFYQLNLPEGSKAFPEYEVEIEEVIDPATGEPVARDNPDSPVVLLGDSFTNIYSTEEPNERGMKWGTGAGFGEHLMLELGRPVQVIALNGGAPTLTRKELNKRSGLKGKRLVIWSFATRELIAPGTEWELVRMVDAPPRKAAAGPLVVTAEVVVASGAPPQGGDPYPEALTYTRYKVLSVESGSFEGIDMVAIEWVMRNFELTKAAEYKAGNVHRLRLVSWDEKVREMPELEAQKYEDKTDTWGEIPYYWVESSEEAN